MTKPHDEFLNYIEAGFRVIRLHAINKNGACACEDGENCEMAGKHPFSSGWQHTAPLDAEQIETMSELGWLNQYGVLIDKHLVIDIDPRNGGDESFKKLCRDLKIDLMAVSGHVVKTGGGGHHVFFKVPENHPLLTKLPQYPGIDFKTNGFVVGAGSKHKSGNIYEVIEGYPQDAEEAPNELLAILKRESSHHRIILNNEPVTVDEAELVKMLDHIPADDYDDWITVGMGLHHATNGVGVDLWDSWSKKSEKYDDYHQIQKRWHSFGKSPNPRTIGTIYHLAEQHGYIQSVTFEAGEAIKRMIDTDDALEVEVPSMDDDSVIEPTAPINYKAINRLSPPGFVGEVANYIKEQNMRPRDWLSVMGALSLVGNAGGLRFKDDISGVTPNIFFMGVADSGTSKNSVIESCLDLYRSLGIADAVNGRIKSEQELIRNLMEHQANFYMVDEFGKFLGKISKSGSGTAHYLDGITGVLMDAYSKADGYFMLSGDQRRQYKSELSRELKNVRLRLSADEYDSNSDRAIDLEKEGKLKQLLKEAENGIKKPFISITAFTTSIGFNEFFSKETVLDGFLGRCLMFKETDSAPPMNKLKNRRNWDDQIIRKMMSIHNGTSFSMQPGRRIEYARDRKLIKTSEEAKKLLNRVSNFFNDLAVYYSKTNGFEALALRGYEAVSKVSLILSLADEVRTVEHVEYAFAVVMHDLGDKINLVVHNETSGAKTNDELVEHFKTRVLTKLSNDDVAKSIMIRELTTGKDKMAKNDAEPFLQAMENKGLIKCYQVKGKGFKYKKV